MIYIYLSVKVISFIIIELYLLKLIFGRIFNLITYSKKYKNIDEMPYIF